ncbi:hypothetical protein K2173_009060 [Erythroxylum novogranatense]|uniref:NAC domain-containing protein n=1 Tax=Erythroxylum novogranatense TaxID=1862640 RepID=A0AAV8TT91_9ROSI|nr:hypothetical protein K2173_009060 [Erythroxylum novogranatense]
MWVPSGFKFVPEDRELVNDYLLKKVKGESIPFNPFIECDIYSAGSCPWMDVFNRSSQNTHYFFTKLKKKNGRGKRIERGSGFGTWRAQTDKTIKDINGNPIGAKKFLAFIPKKKKPTSSSSSLTVDDKFQYIMHEYRLLDENEHEDRNYVLCRINKRRKRTSKRRENYSDDEHHGHQDHEVVVDGQDIIHTPLSGQLSDHTINDLEILDQQSSNLTVNYGHELENFSQQSSDPSINLDHSSGIPTPQSSELMIISWTTMPTMKEDNLDVSLTNHNDQPQPIDGATSYDIHWSTEDEKLLADIQWKAERQHDFGYNFSFSDQAKKDDEAFQELWDSLFSPLPTTAELDFNFTDSETSGLEMIDFTDSFF